MAGTTFFFSSSEPLTEDQIAQRSRDIRAAMQQPVNGQMADLDARILELENRYEMSSATMTMKVRAGELRETRDIGTWLMLLRLREHATTA